MTDTVPVTTKKDWTSDQEVRWCPGCGDYSILTAMQMLMPAGSRPCSSPGSAAPAASPIT